MTQSIVSTSSGPDDKLMIRLRDLHKVYDSGPSAVHALRGLNVDIADGRYVAIMGASGCGKSTLLNILGALDVPTEGTYSIAGQETGTLDRDELASLRNTYIGFIFQNFNLLTRCTAFENVELPMVYAGVPARQRRDAAVAALERVDLADRMDHIPSQLSGGQQQRVAIARALVNHPRVLLADEPTGNLDSHTSQEIMKSLRHLHEVEKLTIVLVTHDPGVASFTERVIVLRDGEIITDQPTPRCGGPEVPDVRALTLAEA
ncbi:MAG: ABC transporter ATP-binding protein [Planctomycetota bacterium]|nr:ABC transporter ATP-binding protein [Planctomycetota bacterium]MCZ6699882.1 ABC transporter ATP-binding protein [Planctomycetota bacterium]MCZ6815648.1 ABC transporter ATP-binding protein [Planctomycetota bacterium]